MISSVNDIAESCNDALSKAVFHVPISIPYTAIAIAGDEDLTECYRLASELIKVKALYIYRNILTEDSTMKLDSAVDEAYCQLLSGRDALISECTSEKAATILDIILSNVRPNYPDTFCSLVDIIKSE